MANELAQKTKSGISKNILHPFEELERLFEDFGSRGFLRPFHWDSQWHDKKVAFEGRIPNVDMVECDGEILVKAELPGVDKKDLDVSMTKNAVTIIANTKNEEVQKEGDYYRSEITKGSFLRTLRLPADVDEDHVKAKFKDGVLELTLSKVDKADRRKIKVD